MIMLIIINNNNNNYYYYYYYHYNSHLYSTNSKVPWLHKEFKSMVLRNYSLSNERPVGKGYNFFLRLYIACVIFVVCAA